ncbi:chorion class A protein Ld19-like [Epargyreus clarus]|uniref:chorion class A protein Ld19-like n=1 Tax=Epargyreus clarus TaxID=520877 RepID=UPI003C2CE8C1
MSTFSFVLLCAQACLLQNVFSQCIGPAVGPWGAALGPALAAGPLTAAWGLPLAGGIASPLAGPLATGPVCAYGGAGIGEVAVAGELPVAGTTLVAGQVPILGAVEFGGPVCAGGTVSIAGSCACGCGGPYII